MIYFGADLHLGHRNVIDFSDRPFSSLEDMNNFFISELDRIIKPGDEVYLLGDITWKNHRYFLEKIQGKKKGITLIKGNHDGKETIKDKHWKEVLDYKEIKIGETKLVLCHYPIESWNKMRYGSIHLHGHTHNNISNEVNKIDNRLDVGYDSTKKVLISIDEVLNRINNENENMGYCSNFDDITSLG